MRLRKRFAYLQFFADNQCSQAPNNLQSEDTTTSATR